VELAGVVDGDIVHGHHVRVLELRERLRLAPEPLRHLHVRITTVQELHRHAPTELRIRRLPHRSHPTGSELPHDAITSDVRAFGGHGSLIQSAISFASASAGGGAPASCAIAAFAITSPSARLPRSRS